MANNKHKWKPQDRRLIKGDILRCIVQNPHHKKNGQHAYAVCSGFGFGCNPGALGNAIFVNHVGFDLDEVIKKRNSPPDDNNKDRWERFWEIEYLQGDEQ